MAKGKKNSARAEWMLNFVDWRLDAEEKKAFNAYYDKQGTELLSEANTLLQSNYKMTISYDENNNSFLCTLVPKDEKDPNKGWALTSRAADPFKAIAISLWKHFHLCDDGEWPVDDARYHDDEG